MPSNYKFTEGGTVKNFDDVFVTRDDIESVPGGGPGSFTVSGQDIQDYFADDESVIDSLVGDTLWAWGATSLGQTGSGRLNQNGYFSSLATPVTTFAGGTTWKQVSANSAHVAAVKTDGTLWIWGANSFGQLGINNTTFKSTPVTTFVGGTDWKQVACGGRFTSAVTDAFTAAIKTDGTLWTWGRNSYANLGTNNTTQRNTPGTTFVGGTTWKQVSCGQGFVAAIKTDGTLWTWGRNAYAQLGINAGGSATGRSTPVTTFLGGTDWKEVACGSSHVLAIKNDGTLWTWGRNNNRQLGINATNANISTPVTTFLGGTTWKKVAGGYSHSAAIKYDGTLWLWGSGGSGQLGHNATTNRSTPVTTFSGGTNWKQVSCGYNFTGATKTDGTLWTWGYNAYFELGINNTTNKQTPVTTFAGGTNWKQVSVATHGRTGTAVKSGLSSQPAIPTTNFIDSTGTDLGRKLITKAYYNDVLNL
jgi:alpha-tubulin suppressor-like RCC1 family protein